jgi:hypothetical protein
VGNDELGAMFDAMQRAVAEGRQVPFASVFQGTYDSPKHGMDTWIHEACSPEWSCSLTDAALPYGMNQTIYQGLSMLEGLSMLDRARRIVHDDAPVLDANVLGPLAGAGTAAAPFEMDGVPFAQLLDVDKGTETAFTDYSACGGDAKDDGPATVFHLKVAADQTVTFFAFNRDGNPVDARVYHFTGGLDPAQCKDASSYATGPTFRKQLTLTAGDHYFVVDVPAHTGRTELVFGVSPLKLR